jgi:hypothetical protein
MNYSDDDEIRYLEAKRQTLEKRLKRLQAAIAILKNGIADSTNATPAIEDICRFLEENEGAQHQSTILEKIGEERNRRYPAVRNQYETIWRALEYHVRHHRRISCVDPETGLEVELKPLPPRPPEWRKRPNVPLPFQADNWFMLLYEEEHLPAAKHEGKETKAGN